MCINKSFQKIRPTSTPNNNKLVAQPSQTEPFTTINHYDNISSTTTSSTTSSSTLPSSSRRSEHPKRKSTPERNEDKSRINKQTKPYLEELFGPSSSPSPPKPPRKLTPILPNNDVSKDSRKNNNKLGAQPVTYYYTFTHYYIIHMTYYNIRHIICSIYSRASIKKICSKLQTIKPFVEPPR